jgi:hypothetical protein
MSCALISLYKFIRSTLFFNFKATSFRVSRNIVTAPAQIEVSVAVLNKPKTFTEPVTDLNNSLECIFHIGLCSHDVPRYD